MSAAVICAFDVGRLLCKKEEGDLGVGLNALPTPAKRTGNALIAVSRSNRRKYHLLYL